MDVRLQTREHLAARLTALRDDDLVALLARVDFRRSVHGSQFGILLLDGAKVFVKQIALTAVEQASSWSTANHFDLPLFYQYGVGSAGFGAWRELAAYRQASDWALTGKCPHFLLLHHWRILHMGRREPLTPDRQSWLDRAPDYWGGSQAVRHRLDAIAAAPATITLFLEHAPQTLHEWLEPRLSDASCDAESEATILEFHRQLDEAAAFMNACGMLHFDLHAHNLLTDGVNLYVTDFGLSICEDFDLSLQERAFFENHRLYDRSYVRWLFGGRLAPETNPPSLTPALRALADRCAPTRDVLEAFFRELRGANKTALYPSSSLAATFASPA